MYDEVCDPGVVDQEVLREGVLCVVMLSGLVAVSRVYKFSERDFALFCHHRCCYLKLSTREFSQHSVP